MKYLSKIISAATVLAGLVGSGLQLALSASIDERGLIPAGLPAQTILNILSICLLCGLLVYVLLCKNRDFRILLPIPIQAVGCFAAAAAHFIVLLTAPDAIVIFTVCRIAAIVGFLFLAFFRLTSKKPPLLFFALVSLSMMVLCFGQYRVWGQRTQLHAYLFPALSALFTALYSLDFFFMETQERSCKRTFFLNQAALFCNLVCLLSGNGFYYAATALWLISGLFTTPYKMTFPANVKKCITMLEKAGHTAYAVGGCVRDTLTGLKPHDYDLCTSATPDELCEIFGRYKLVRSGEQHGTIGVIMDDTVYEITTYRTETGYADNRRPDKVEFIDDITQDLLRRDFTINAIACHPRKGYLDPWGGQRDMMRRTLRTVGDPEDCFKEDALRILRGVRFACRFRLDVERSTMKAMKKLSGLQDNLSRERVYSELTQILLSVQKDDLKRFAPVLLQSIPELEATVSFQQHSIHHAYDVFTHTQRVVEAVPAHPALRWAALLHDIGKPATFQKDAQGQGHFHGHAKAGAELAEQVLLRFKASTALREQVVFLILHHMDTLEADKKALARKVSRCGYDNLTKLIALQMADETGKGKKKPNLSHYEKLLKLLEQLKKEGACMQTADLKINGHDLMKLGFEEGPAIGQCQKWLLQKVLDGEIRNEKDILLEKAKEYLKQE